MYRDKESRRVKPKLERLLQRQEEIGGMGWIAPMDLKRRGFPGKPTRRLLQTWHTNGV